MAASDEQQSVASTPIDGAEAAETTSSEGARRRRGRRGGRRRRRQDGSTTATPDNEAGSSSQSEIDFDEDSVDDESALGASDVSAARTSTMHTPSFASGLPVTSAESDFDDLGPASSAVNAKPQAAPVPLVKAVPAARPANPDPASSMPGFAAAIPAAEPTPSAPRPAGEKELAPAPTESLRIVAVPPNVSNENLWSKPVIQASVHIDSSVPTDASAPPTLAPAPEALRGSDLASDEETTTDHRQKPAV
jgi:ribonuclease E